MSVSRPLISLSAVLATELIADGRRAARKLQLFGAHAQSGGNGASSGRLPVTAGRTDRVGRAGVERLSPTTDDVSRTRYRR